MKSKNGEFNFGKTMRKKTMRKLEIKTLNILHNAKTFAFLSNRNFAKGMSVNTSKAKIIENHLMYSGLLGNGVKAAMEFEKRIPIAIRNAATKKIGAKVVL